MASVAPDISQAVQDYVKAIYSLGARLGQPVSTSALADRLGVSERTVRRWLAGDTDPRFRELLRISSLLGNPPV